jgi:hypothetical protein
MFFPFVEPMKAIVVQDCFHRGTGIGFPLAIGQGGTGSSVSGNPKIVLLYPIYQK